MRWWLGAAGPSRIDCGPAAPLGHVVGRRLQLTVRRHVLLGRLATLSNHHTLWNRSACRAANRTRPSHLGQLIHEDTPAICEHDHLF